MKLFEADTNLTQTEEECTAAVLETIPLVMGSFRAEMRRHRPADMTVPQFRTLFYIKRHANASLSDVAHFLDLTLSSTSKLVDGLVKRDLIIRETATDDRRKIVLRLTESGIALLAATHRHAQVRLGETLSALTAEERPVVIRAMQILQRVFNPLDSEQCGHTPDKKCGK